MVECITCSHKKVCKYAEQYVSAGIKVKETVHECVDYAPTAEWIDVKDRLPEHLKSVLIFDSDKDMLVGFYSEKLNMWQSEFSDYLYEDECRVTHWMPLPEPPKGEVENG